MKTKSLHFGAIGAFLLMGFGSTETAAEAYDGGITKWGPALTLESADGEFSMKMRGRLMIDLWSISGEGKALGNDGDFDAPSGWDFRRARLGIEGTAFQDWRYLFEADYNGDEVAIKDAFIEYQGWADVSAKVGHHKEPFSIEQLTSSRYITFMERSLADMFVPARSVGASLTYKTEKFAISGGVFGPAFGDRASGNNDDRTSLTARATFSPVNSGTRILHLGGAVSIRDFNDSGATFRVRTRPEVHLFDIGLIDTGTRPADDVTLYGFEAAAVLGPVSLQSEYITAKVDFVDPDRAKPTFSGFYAYASWFITGESRPYAGGVFGRVQPGNPVNEGGTGAWEIAIRYSRADLQSSMSPLTPTLGGKEDNFTIGVNWYLTGYVRMMLNYVNFDVKASFEETPFGLDELKGDALGARLQIHW